MLLRNQYDKGYLLFAVCGHSIIDVYWYHSLTLLQEQTGVFGSIVIYPKEETLVYDKELMLVLSDWINDKPMNVLRFLKRGTAWYQWRKGIVKP